MGTLRLVFAFILILLIVAVCLQNVGQGQIVSVVHVFHESFENQPLGLVLLVATAIGMILAFLISLLSEIKLRRVIWMQKREIKMLNAELTALRNLPLVQEAENEPAQKTASGSGGRKTA